MKIYIANTTRQHVALMVRIPEINQPVRFEIPSGQQIPLGDGFSELQTAAVISHVERFGAKPASNLSGKMDDFSGLLYRVERPVTEAQIISANEVVTNSQQKRSVNEAIKAVESFDVLTREKGGKGKRNAKETSIEIESMTVSESGKVSKEPLMKVTVGEGGDSDKSIRAS